MKRFAPCILALTAALLSACAASEAPDEAAETEDAVVVRVSRHAIVLAHGFDASTTNRWAFYQVEPLLKDKGFVVVSARVAPYQGVKTRAEQLAGDVDRALAACRAKPDCDASKVHIVAHSMGGLDARYLVSQLGYEGRVASLTTISTPHRGSKIADVLLNLLDEEHDVAVNAIASAWARTFTSADLAQGSDVRAALEGISEKSAPAFNALVTKKPGVKYFSWAGVSGIPKATDMEVCENKFSPRWGRDAMHWSLVPAAPIVQHGLERPSDGMVLVESAKWETFKGCIPADHLDEVGQPASDHPNVLGGFDHRRFYLELASSLDADTYGTQR